MKNNNVQITLRAARVNAGLTLVSAAKQIGIGKDTLMKWERKPELVNAAYQARISAVYEFPIDNIYFASN